MVFLDVFIGIMRTKHILTIFILWGEKNNRIKDKRQLIFAQNGCTYCLVKILIAYLLLFSLCFSKTLHACYVASFTSSPSTFFLSQ